MGGQERSKSWLWKGLLLVGAGLVAARVGKKYSEPLRAGTSHLSRWANDQLQSTGGIIKEKWQEVMSETSEQEPARTIDATGQVESTSNRDPRRLEQVTNPVKGLASEAIPRRRVTPLAYRRYKQRSSPKAD